MKATLVEKEKEKTSNLMSIRLNREPQDGWMDE
jgi:hypothetical protein